MDLTKARILRFLMELSFEIGDVKEFTRLVREQDLAHFDDGRVHPVYSTFALTRDAEWTCRLFVLDMLDEDEEGIGTFVHVNHRSPALLGQTVRFRAEVVKISGNEVRCAFSAFVDNRLIAVGQQGQRILKKTRVRDLFDRHA